MPARPAPAAYVDSPSWMQQHLGADGETTCCGLPIPRAAAWSSHRGRKPLCTPCAAADVLEEVGAPGAAVESVRQPAVEQLRLV